MKIYVFFLCFIVLISTVSPFSKFDFIKTYVEYVRKAVDGIIERSGGNTKCAKDLRTFISDLSSRKMWALKMIDASAKIQPGLLVGNILQVGHYDECLSIDTEHGIKGQYCSVVLLPSKNHTSKYSQLFDVSTLVEYIAARAVKKNHQISDIVRHVKLVFGICLPQSCSMQNLQDIFQAVEHFYKSPVQTMFVDFLCDYKGKPLAPYSIDKYVYLFFGFMLLVMALSTLYDLCTGEDNKDDPLIAFSLKNNLKKLLSLNSNESTLTCLSGVKVLSMLWVIQGHRFAANGLSLNVNPVYVFLDWRAEWMSAFIYSGTFAVDTFFTVSGMLVMYSKLLISEKMHVSLANFYLFRYLRLTPALAATILFYLSIAKHTSSGPAWPLVVWKTSGSCYKTWWATLFYFSNYIPANQGCIEHGWYLGIDTQLYIFAPIALYNIKNHPKKTLWGMALFCISSMAYAFIKTYVNRLDSVPNNINRDFVHNYYYSAFARSSPYVLGLFLGYFIYKNTKVPYTINKNLNVFLWILTLLGLLGLVHSTYLVANQDEYNVFHAALYNSLARPVWSLGISWIIFSCATGNGGIVNKFLSAPVFMVLGRLTYSAYLIHFWCIIVLKGSQRTQLHFNNIQSLHDLGGDIIFIIICSTALALTFEFPFLTLMKIASKSYIKAEMEKKSQPTSHNKETNTETSGFTRAKLWIYFTNRKENVKLE